MGNRNQQIHLVENGIVNIFTPVHILSSYAYDTKMQKMKNTYN